MSTVTGGGPGKLAALPAKAPAKKPTAPAPVDDDLAALFTEPESGPTASPNGAPSTGPEDDFLSEFADPAPSPAASATTAQTTGGKKTVAIPAGKKGGPALVPASKKAPAAVVEEAGKKYGTKGIPLEESNELGLKGSEVFLAGLPKSGTEETGVAAKAAAVKRPAAASLALSKKPEASTKTAVPAAQKTIVAPAPKPVQDSMMPHFDTSLLERPIESDEAAEAYVAETWLPWANMTEVQKYTRTYCLAYLLEGRRARHAMLRAILDGEAPVGLSVTINELGRIVATGQPTFNELVEAGVGVVAAHAAVLEREDDGADDDFEEEALEEGDLELVESLELAPAPAGVVYDDDAQAEDDLGWATDTGQDTSVGPSFSHAEPDEKYEGPVSPTDIKLLPDVVRPIVVAFMREKDMGKQGELERKLGLDIINSHSSVRSMSGDIRKGREVQETPFNSTVDAATTALINEGTRLWKLRQAHTQPDASKASAPVQMEAMREKCRNHSVGCDSARALHRKGTGQCYSDKCACKGKCAGFVGAPTETPEPEGPKSDGEPAADEGAGEAADSGLMDEFADEPVAEEVGATAPAPPRDPRLDAKHALHNRAGKLHCKLCAGSAALHENFQGVRWAGEPNRSALKCKGFQPENDEKGMEWLALLEDMEKFNAEEDEGQSAETKSAGGPDSGGGGLGTGGQTPDGGAGRVQPPPARTAAGSGQPAARPQLPPPPPPREATGGGVAQEGRATAVPPTGPTTPPQPVRRGPENGEAREGSGSGAAAGTQENAPASVEGPAGGQGQATPAGPEESAGPEPEEAPTEPAARLRFLGATSEPDANSISTERRDAMLARFEAWWEKSIHVEVGGQTVLREDIDLNSRSYRVVLAARELWAQLERYATAHRKGAAAPPDEEMIPLVFKAVVAYFDAHRPLPAGQVDVDWATYAEFCETWNIEVGPPYHELLAAMIGDEGQPKVV